jgi:hypothetical protein
MKGFKVWSCKNFCYIQGFVPFEIARIEYNPYEVQEKEVDELKVRKRIFVNA